MSVPDQFEARLQALEERLVQFMAREFEAVRREIAALERRVGFLGEVTAGLQSQMGSLVK